MEHFFSGYARARPRRVTTERASLSEPVGEEALPRDHAHWVVGCQGDFMAQPRGLGCPLPFCPKLGGHREEREEKGKLGLARVAPMMAWVV
jgi:hypothetical protein